MTMLAADKSISPNKVNPNQTDEDLYSDILDDAEAEAEMLQQDTIDEIDELEMHFHDKANSLKDLLRLSFMERLMWLIGIQLSHRELAERMFRFVDKNQNGSVCVASLDILLKQLQDDLPFTKASFDFVEV
jgi:Ca2+-binding EF-hand superfamily protein